MVVETNASRADPSTSTRRSSSPSTTDPCPSSDSRTASTSDPNNTGRESRFHPDPGFFNPIRFSDFEIFGIILFGPKEL